MELQQLGWNVLTVGFLGTIIFTFPEGWGCYRQGRMIWRPIEQRDDQTTPGESVSVITFVYLASVFAALLIYGLSTGRIAAIFNGGVLFALHLPILIGLWKFKGYSRLEKGTAAGLIGVLVAMAILPYKGEFFLVICAVSLVTLIAQPLEIIRNRSRGDVEPRLFGVLLVSESFWVAYAFALGDRPLMIITPIGALILGATLILCLVYKNRTRPRPS